MVGGGKGCRDILELALEGRLQTISMQVMCVVDNDPHAPGAAFAQEHNIPVLQINRWETLLEDHMARAAAADLDAEFIKAVFELIHAQSVRRQL